MNAHLFEAPSAQASDWNWAEDPFGPDDLIPKVTSEPVWKDNTRKKADFKVRSHYPRAKEILKEMHGGMYWTCDRKEVLYNGMQVSIDLLGFMDIEGIAGGRHYSCNVTTEGSMGAHVRHYIDPDNTYSQAKEKVVDLLRGYLANGGTFYIIGGYQPKGKGTKWHYKVMRVDEELLAKFESRRRRTA